MFRRWCVAMGPALVVCVSCAQPVEPSPATDKAAEDAFVLVSLTPEQAADVTFVHSYEDLLAHDAALLVAQGNMEIGGTTQALGPMVVAIPVYKIGAGVLAVITAYTFHRYIADPPELPEVSFDGVFNGPNLLQMGLITALVISAGLAELHPEADQRRADEMADAAERLLSVSDRRFIRAQDMGHRPIVRADGLRRHVVVFRRTGEGTEAELQQQVERLERVHGSVVEDVLGVSLFGFVSRPMNEGLAMQLSRDAAVAWVEEDGWIPATPLEIRSVDSERAGAGARANTDADTDDCRPEGALDAEGHPISNPNGPPWTLDRIDQRQLPYDCQYNPAGDGAGVTIYVMDDGVYPIEWLQDRMVEHEFLRESDTKDDPEFDCSQHGGHGTSVASAAAGSQYGVAKAANVVSVKVGACGFMAVSAISRGMNWIAKQIQGGFHPAVVNQSFGGAGPSIRAAEIRAKDRVEGLRPSVLIVKAAGNEAEDSEKSDYADYESGLIVGGTNSQDFLWAYIDEGESGLQRYLGSNIGKSVAIYAPGHSFPVAVSPRRGPAPPRMELASGSSLAAPMVAGAAAIYLGHYPRRGRVRIRNAILRSATPGVIRGPSGLPITRPNHNRLLYVGEELLSR